MGKHRKPPSKTGANDTVKKSTIVKSTFTKSKRQANDSDKLLFLPKPDWYNESLPEISTHDSLRPVPAQVLDAVQQYAESLLEKEAALYASSHMENSSSHKFMSTIMLSGTWSDKVSALTLVVQESPLHTFKSFESLVTLAGKKSRNQALMALGALKDMLGQGNVLPTQRKLRTFKKQPALTAAMQGTKSWKVHDPLPKGLLKSHLVFWAFEDRLKRMYFEVLRVLERWCNDEVEFARMRAVTFASELLQEKPEQEENLLRLVVNKLGDKDKKVASRASYLLLQLQVTHPSMKEIIINAIQSDVILRPGQTSHAIYYAIITLNQTVLNGNNPEVANKLLDVYFNLFVTILNHHQKGHSSTSKVMETNDKTKKRKRQTPTNSVGAEKAEQELDDKVTAQVLTGINRAFPFSNSDSGTFEKHVDTMFRITHSSNFNTSIQALLLIQQISSAHHITTDRFMRTLYESLLDPRLIKSSKQTMYLNLLYRSLKVDVSVRRVKAFVKRMLQVLHLHDPPFVTAVFYLTHELQSLFPALKSMLVQPEASDDDTEEHFHDVVDPTDQDSQKARAQVNGTPSALPSTTYDARKRDPEHSHADQTCLWELTSPFVTHYHPSVSLFSRSLVPSFRTPMPPKPDPTTHTLSHFLDRFVYRNPKTKHLKQTQQPSSAGSAGIPLRGSSLMQPALGASSSDLLLTKSGRGDAVAAPVNSEAFWARRSEVQVAPDEVFFHRYFAGVGTRKTKAQIKKDRKREKKRGRGGDEDEVDSELGVGEDEIWKALVGSGGAGLEGEDEGSEGFAASDVDYDEDEDDEREEGGDGVLLGDDFDQDADDVESIEGPDEDDEVELNLESDGDSAILGSEDEIAGVESDEEEVAGAPGVEKTETMTDGRRKRRKLKSLPMFADADDYAKMLEGDNDEDG